MNWGNPTYHEDLPPLNGGQVILNKGANFYDPDKTGQLPLDPMDAGPIDILRTWFIPLNGHGTGTLSVLLCPDGKKIIGTALPWKTERARDMTKTMKYFRSCIEDDGLLGVHHLAELLQADDLGMIQHRRG